MAAVVAGAWASGALARPEQALPLATALALVLGGWLLFWLVLTTTDWATPLSAWRSWDQPTDLRPLPYLQDQTPGAALHRSLMLARGWWQSVGRKAMSPALGGLALSLAVSILLSAVLGRRALLLTGLFLAWAEMAALWHEGRAHTAGAGWAAVALVGLPWTLGSSLGSGDAGPLALAGLVLSVLIGFYGGATPIAVLGPLLGAAFLVWHGSYLIAGLLLLCAVPGLLLLLHHPSEATYRRAIVPWMLCMVALMAAGI